MGSKYTRPHGVLLISSIEDIYARARGLTEAPAGWDAKRMPAKENG